MGVDRARLLVLTFGAAALSLMGFVPQRLEFVDAVLAQVAGSFVSWWLRRRVGGVALNVRFVQRSGG